MKKAYKHIDKMINKAKAERDKKGYRECLGFDQYPKVLNYLATRSLHYQEECEIKDYLINNAA